MPARRGEAPRSDDTPETLWNVFSSPGARLLSKLLGENSVLSTLNLADNQVLYRGQGAVHSCRVVKFYFSKMEAGTWVAMLGHRVPRLQPHHARSTDASPPGFRGFIEALAVGVGSALFINNQPHPDSFGGVLILLPPPPESPTF